MIHRCFMMLFLFGIIPGSSASLLATRTQGNEQSSKSHVAWVTDALMRMQRIKPGMTRNELYTVFTTEGGLYTDLQRTYVSRDCPYFKVDVEFNAVGRPDPDREGRVPLLEDGRDIIVKISKPYLEFTRSD